MAFAAAAAAAGAAGTQLRGGDSVATKAIESSAAAAAKLVRAAAGQSAELLRSKFLPHVGSVFHMSEDGRSRRAVLSEVNDLNVATDNERQFSLIFTTTGGGTNQGLFGFTHSELGRMALFAVPGARTAAGQRFQVVVNRQRS